VQQHGATRGRVVGGASLLATKEATARIKINWLLDEAGWRFFDDENGQANIVLEPNVKIKTSDIEALGQDFEKAKNGFIDFLLLDRDGRPLIVLEAKSEEKNPLSAKEQARKYALPLGFAARKSLHHFQVPRPQRDQKSLFV
jgi:type I site-specific restriction endonuclease